METPLFGAIAEGKYDGIPLAVVEIDPVVDVVGSMIIVEGMNGFVGEAVYDVSGGMLVTPSSGSLLVLEVWVEVLIVVDGRVVVLGGNTVPFPEKELVNVVECGGRVNVELWPGPPPIPVVEECGGSEEVLVPVADVVELDDTVLLAVPVAVVVVPDSVPVVVSVEVAVAVPLEIPVPGPEIPSVGLTVVSVELAPVGSKMLEMAESMLLKMELSGSPGSDVVAVLSVVFVLSVVAVVDVVVTIPVGAITMEDLVVVEAVDSSEVEVLVVADDFSDVDEPVEDAFVSSEVAEVAALVLRVVVLVAVLVVVLLSPKIGGIEINVGRCQ